MVKSPTHLMLTVMPRPRPVMASQNHQLKPKAREGPSSCWLVKDVKAKAVKAVAIIRGESRRIRRAWVRSPFSTRRVSMMVTDKLSEGGGIEELTKDDESSAHSRGESAATGSLKSQEHGRGEKDATDGREHAHGHIWHARLEIVLANVLEVEVSVEAGQEAKEGDHQLRERGVDVHEEFALDVLGSKAAEAVGRAPLALVSQVLRIA